MPPSLEPMASTMTTCGTRSIKASLFSAANITPDETMKLSVLVS